MDRVAVRNLIKEIGIDIDNIPENIKKLQKERFKLSGNSLKKFWANRTIKEIILLEKDFLNMIDVSNPSKHFDYGVTWERFNTRISNLMPFLTAS